MPKLQANPLTLLATTAGRLEKIYRHGLSPALRDGASCRRLASKQNSLTAQRVFGVDMAPAELELVSRLKGSLLYQFPLIDKTKKCKQPSLLSSRSDNILDKQDLC